MSGHISGRRAAPPWLGKVAVNHFGPSGIALPTLRRGFTLMEILIVTVILAILSLIVVPQFSSASTDAKLSDVSGQLQTLRNMVQLYRVQHNLALPNLTTPQWADLLNPSDASGKLNPAGPYGPYLDAAPLNPLNNNTKVILSTSHPDATTGWIYDNNTGAITATNQNAATALFDENNPEVR